VSSESSGKKLLIVVEGWHNMEALRGENNLEEESQVRKQREGTVQKVGNLRNGEKLKRILPKDGIEKRKGGGAKMYGCE